MNQQKTLLARPVTVIAIAVFVCMGLHRGARTVADESGSWSGLFTRPFSGLTGGKSGSPTPATAQGDLVLAARRPPAPSESDPSPDSANTVESTLSLNPGFSGGINRQGAALAALQDAAGNQQSAIYPANSSNDPGIPHGVPQRGPTNGDAATARIHPTNSASIETTQRRGMELASSVVGATSPQHVPHSVAAAASGNTVVTHSLDPKTGTQRMVIVDVVKEKMAVWLLDSAGVPHLQSVRDYGGDMQLQFNASSPLPEHIREMVR